jgi:hypothetical protein
MQAVLLQQVSVGELAKSSSSMVDSEETHSSGEGSWRAPFLQSTKIRVGQDVSSCLNRINCAAQCQRSIRKSGGKRKLEFRAGISVPCYCPARLVMGYFGTAK